LPAINLVLVTCSAAIEALQTTIRHRHSVMQAQLQAFEALC